MDSYSMTNTIDEVEANMGDWYHYEVQGYYARLNATAPVGAEVLSNGRFSTSGKNKQEDLVDAHLKIQAFVNGQSVGNALTLTDGRATGTTDDIEVVSPLPAIDESNVTLKFVLTTNVSNPDGYLILMGTGVKQPPKPVGELDTPLYAEVGTKPNIGWKVVKNMEMISSKNDGLTGSVTIPDPVGDLGGWDDANADDDDDDRDDDDFGSDDSVSYDDALDGWRGSGKSNNGHGNNIDGVDVSNPGKGHGGPNAMKDYEGMEVFYSKEEAEAYAESCYGSADAVPSDAVFEVDGVWCVDDEGRGGGAYPSK
ncbi:hypothetical protein [Sulfuriroseicoccus oceanibius]|uniref:Uncharacterized protein n=1 Tax=Sulfuriroseicoccus oceanibius TaxID=2707525 RepID=A0A7T7JBR7_9BACT|nr:hypothetical protein [Sulfuriroseicoccus oceanibius]QQL44528.1 hypothetical protein G3M56_011645 [Sulfuriroseicoccus oceanibius]